MDRDTLDPSPFIKGCFAQSLIEIDQPREKMKIRKVSQIEYK